MQYTVEQICEKLGDLVTSISDPTATFSMISALEDFSSESLVFMSNESDLKIIQGQSQLPAIIATHANLTKHVNKMEVATVELTNVRLGLAICKQHFDDYQATDSEWPDIHPSAVIHPSAKLGSGVRIGPNTVIGAEVEIADQVQIRANCVIEHGAYIGSQSVLHNLVNIGYSTVIGERVIIRSGAIIGGEGFGFAQDDQNHYHRLPHTGVVHIDNDVQIGSNCNIDRATFGVTSIAHGAKIDALCHIAHNVSVGEHVLLVAQCGVAGSSRIGDRAILSGQTGVLDHKTIAADAVLVHRCGVTSDISESGMWAGIPPKPFKQYVKEVNLSKRVDRLEQKVREAQ